MAEVDDDTCLASFGATPDSRRDKASPKEDCAGVTMKILELNHVAILVADVERSCDFYARVLRLSPLPRPAFDFPGAWFRLGTNQELHLIGNRAEPVLAGSRGNHFALQVEDLPAWEQRLRVVGAEFRPKKQRPDGAWQIFVRDPDGHFIELFTPPG